MPWEGVLSEAAVIVGGTLGHERRHTGGAWAGGARRIRSLVAG